MKFHEFGESKSPIDFPKKMRQKIKEKFAKMNRKILRLKSVLLKKSSRGNCYHVDQLVIPSIII